MSPADEQQELCFKLLLALARREEHAYRNRYTSKLSQFRDSLASRLPPLHVDDLERVIGPKAGPAAELAPRRKFVFFEAWDEGGWFIPVATLAYDFASEPVELRFRVGFFGVDGAAAGYRFETPEGVGGAHGFFHAQPIVGWTVGDTDIRNDAVNMSQPSFPIDADSPVTLIVAAVISCYGLEYLSGLINNREFQRLPPHLGELGWHVLTTAGGS